MTLPAGASLEPESPGLLISVLGSVRVSLRGSEIPFPKRKARALLAYLALTEGHQDTRERLGGLLWSEVPEGRARTSLRQELHQVHEILRRAGGRGLRRDRLRVVLLDRVESVDANLILALASEGAIHPRLIEEPLISDSFLRDIDDVDPAFAIWSRARRQSFHDQLLVCLERILRSDVDYRAHRRRCAQAILNLDPTHEEACRVFMRLSAEAGDPMAAQRAYNALYVLLDKDYDAEPGPETIALIAAIKQGLIPPVPDPIETVARAGAVPGDATAEGTAAASQPAPLTRMTLHVEPFGMNGIAPDNQHLVEGFRHELLVCLVRFREWLLVGGPAPASEPPEDSLGDTYALAATAYRAGDVISMVLTLRERRSGVHLWGARYTLTLDQWFEAQQDVVRKIAIALNVEVSAARLRRIADQPDISLAAYDQWLRGHAAMQRFDKERWQLARRMYLAAIQQAPDFARGYSGLAQVTYLEHVVHPGLALSETAQQEALRLASRAVALDPMDPRSQLTLGWSLTFIGRFQAASVHLDLARDLNPNDGSVILSAAFGHALGGYLAAATQAAEQVRRVTIAPSPLQWAFLTMIAFLAGDDAQAVAAAEQAQELTLPVVAWHAAALALGGNIEAAKARAARCVSLAREQWSTEEPPTLDAIGRWLLTKFRFARSADWTRLRDGLTLAGIVASGVGFGG
ncbi:MAG TPA: BTAD domain-containing putative transcriptional regulator [Rhodopila sp.]|jgi:DNA-binding SARP family transcriptional activator/TolB-like protein|nr:BTAD domain-containing putative transcriptional regulator [Rhodopila sp.]